MVRSNARTVLVRVVLGEARVGGRLLGGGGHRENGDKCKEDAAIEHCCDGVLFGSAQQPRRRDVSLLFTNRLLVEACSHNSNNNPPAERQAGGLGRSLREGRRRASAESAVQRFAFLSFVPLRLGPAWVGSNEQAGLAVRAGSVPSG